MEGKGDGFYNMALNEAILESYPNFRLPTLRLYGWERAFVSLGYNQKAEEVLTFKNNIPFVRRISGGLSILHEQELTYSLVCAPKDLNLPFSVKGSYEVICGFLVEFYKQLGLKAFFAKDVFRDFRKGNTSFCFSQYEPLDLVVAFKKIGGNAQRRRRNLIFQEGSIPLFLDFGKITETIKNVENLEESATYLGRFIQKDFLSLQTLLKKSFAKVFGIEFIKEGLFKEEEELCLYLRESKYSRKEWNYFKGSPTL